MNDIFLSVLNMSLTASIIAAIVLIIRLCLRRAPKKYVYLLWTVVFFRLVCPFSLQSSVSALPTVTPIPQEIVYAKVMPPRPEVPIIDDIVRQTIDANIASEYASVNASYLYLYLGAHLWLIGIAALLAYALTSYFSLKYKLRTATLMWSNIFESEYIRSPFVLGLVHPRIYLPLGLEQDIRSCVLLHEHAHIRRKDHIIKPLAFLVLTLHWFNPLVWLCYYLACQDMELSCDEHVLSRMHGDGRAHYSSALLSLASPHGMRLSPLAFGESSVKTRIRNILRWKAPHRVMCASILTVCVLTLIVCSLNPEPVPTDLTITADRQQLPCVEIQNVSTDASPNWSDLAYLPYVELGQTISIPRAALGDYVEITLRDWMLSESKLPQYQGDGLERNLIVDNQAVSFTLAPHIYSALSSQFPVSDPNARGFRLDVTFENGVRSYLFALQTSNLPFQEISVQSAPTPTGAIGSNGTEIYFYNGRTAVFHDYYGLYVYDVMQRQIDQSVDVRAIGCDMTQGDNACLIRVSENGGTITLHPAASDITYMYDVAQNTMLLRAVSEEDYAAGTSFLQTYEFFGPAESFVSALAVKHGTETAYLAADKGLIENLALHIYDFSSDQTTIIPIFSGKAAQQIDGSIFPKFAAL